MRIRHIAFFSALSLFALGAAACSDDDKKSVGTTDGGADTFRPDGTAAPNDGDLPDGVTRDVVTVEASPDAVTTETMPTDGGSDASDAPLGDGAAVVAFTATLTTAQEVPALIVPAASSGTGTFTLNAAKTALDYDITFQLQGVDADAGADGGGTDAGTGDLAAHFHRGAPGFAGQVVSPIMLAGNRATGTWSGLTVEDVANIEAGRIYVNIHTNGRNANGEIRGQIVRPGEVVYAGTLTSDNEVVDGGVRVPEAGTDKPVGGFGLLVTPNANGGATARYVGEYAKLTAPLSGAHIHVGGPGVAGGVEIPLDLGTPSTTGFFVSPAPVTLTPETVTAINAVPSTRYANYHTTTNPDGEIRDQISKRQP